VRQAEEWGGLVRAGLAGDDATAAQARRRWDRYRRQHHREHSALHALFFLLIGLLQPLAAQTLDVRQYGATGDGQTDDTASIQRCLDAIPGAGGMAVFPPGTYRCSATLTVSGKDNVTLAGQSALLDFTSAADDPPREHSLLLTGSKDRPIANPRIEGLRVRAKKGYGLAIGHFTNATIRDCTVEQSGFSGLYCFFGTGCLIAGNHVVRGGDNGIYTFAVDDASITGNVVEHSSGTGGIAMMIGDGLTVTGNTVRDSDIAGIGTWDICRNVLISANVVVGSRNTGIIVEWNGDWDSRTRDVTVAGNLVSDVAQNAVQVYHGSCGDVVIRGNEIHRSRTGVRLVDCEGVEVIDNRISRMGQDGIRLDGEGDTSCSRILVEGNRVLNCNLQGIWNSFAGVWIRGKHREVTVRGNAIGNDAQELSIWYDGPAQAASITYDCQTLALRHDGQTVKELKLADVPVERVDRLVGMIGDVPGWHAELTGPRFGLVPLFERSGGQIANDQVLELPCRGREGAAVLRAKQLTAGVSVDPEATGVVVEGNRVWGVVGQ